MTSRRRTARPEIHTVSERLDIVIVGLAITSSWGNGHAVTYRGLVRELAEQGHRVTFLERDVPWYRDNRDMPDPPGCATVLYDDLDALKEHTDSIAAADLVIVGSYVPDGVEVGDWVQDVARGVVAFYDIDTPVTLARLARGDELYLAARQIRDYDLYLSFTGGPTLDRLEREFGVPLAKALYCSADPKHYYPEHTELRWDLGYLGTYSDDRQPTVDAFLTRPARVLPEHRFVVAGPQYPEGIDWPDTVERIEHLPPAEHRAFYNAQRFTLNVTRADMRQAGWSPSIRLFEAAACGAPIISDAWPGLESLFIPGDEIVIARSVEHVIAALRDMPEAKRRAMGEAARRRVLARHTAAHRARELVEAWREAAALKRLRGGSRTTGVALGPAVAGGGQA